MTDKDMARVFGNLRGDC
jgi:hypothetical protein